jgi:hypothetical protein
MPFQLTKEGEISNGKLHSMTPSFVSKKKSFFIHFWLVFSAQISVGLVIGRLCVTFMHAALDASHKAHVL